MIKFRSDTNTQNQKSELWMSNTTRTRNLQLHQLKEQMCQTFPNKAPLRPNTQKAKKKKKSSKISGCKKMWHTH